MIMENVEIASWLIWLSSLIGAVTAIIGAVLAVSRKARGVFKSVVRKNTDADGMKQEIEGLKTAVHDMIEMQKTANEDQQIAQQALLRHEITDLYYKHLEDKKLAAYEKEDMIKMSKAYDKNHGNSYVQTIVKEMEQWDIAL